MVILYNSITKTRESEKYDPFNFVQILYYYK